MWVQYLYMVNSEKLVKDGLWKKKKRLHYGNKISGLFPGMCFKNIIVMYVFLFSCDFGKQHGLKNGF